MSSFLAGAEMMTFLTGPRRCFFASSALVKLSGGLDYDLGTYGFPIDFGGIFFGKYLELSIVEFDAVASGRDLVVKVAEYGVILQQVRESLCVGEIVDGDEFNVRDLSGTRARRCGQCVRIR